MPFRVLYLAALPASGEVWSADKREAYCFDHYAEADAAAKQIRDQSGDTHVHAVVLSRHEPRGPVQLRLSLPEVPTRRRRKKNSAPPQHSFTA